MIFFLIQNDYVIEYQRTFIFISDKISCIECSFNADISPQVNNICKENNVSAISNIIKMNGMQIFILREPRKKK